MCPCNKVISKRQSKAIKASWFEKSVCWNKYKTKIQIKNKTNKYRCILKPNFLEVNRLFVLDYSNQDVSVQRFNARKYYSAKDIIKNYNAIINGKNVLWLNSWFKYKTTRIN